MEESLKARLIGAAVLVALAVLLIPELLSGRKAVEPVAEDGMGPRATRTFTIELGQGPGQVPRSAPTSIAPPPAPAAVAGPDASAGGEPVAEAEALVEQSLGPAAVTPAQMQPEAAAPVATPAKVVQEPRAAAPMVEKAPLPAHAEPKPPTASGGGWAVQVGAFSSIETARKLAKDLSGAGYRAFVSPVSKGGKTLHRVRVGPEADRAVAERLAGRLKARGLPATVIRNE